MKTIKNNVKLIGRLGSDPESLDLKSGKKIVKLKVATKDVYNNNKGERIIDTQWHDIIAWGRIAENMEAFLKKGNEVSLNGKLTYKSYKDKKGMRHNLTQVVVSEFMLITQAKKRAEA